MLGRAKVTGTLCPLFVSSLRTFGRRYPAPPNVGGGLRVFARVTGQLALEWHLEAVRWTFMPALRVHPAEVPFPCNA
jgi:hypothetical protein